MRSHRSHQVSLSPPGLGLRSHPYIGVKPLYRDPDDRVDLDSETRPDCANCGCRAASCETKRWLSGRRCCPDCSHKPTERRTTPGGTWPIVNTHEFQPPPVETFLSPVFFYRYVT
jgi:hypothetical protein